MSLTPEEIRHVKLSRSVGGYDRRETEELLAELAGSYEAVWRQRTELAEEVEQLHAGGGAGGEHAEATSGLRELVKHQEAEVEALRQEVSRLEAERDELLRRTPESSPEVAELEDASRRAEAELEGLRKRLAQLEAERADLLGESEQSRKRLAELQEENERRAAELADLQRDAKRRELHEHVRDAESELAQDRDSERRVGRVLLAVDQFAEKVRSEARHEAEVALKKARAKAEEIVRVAERERDRLGAEVRDLRAEKSVEAESLLADARAKGAEIVRAAETQRDRIREELARLEALESETRARYRSFLASALEQLREAGERWPALRSEAASELREVEPERELLSDLTPREDSQAHGAAQLPVPEPEGDRSGHPDEG